MAPGMLALLVLLFLAFGGFFVRDRYGPGAYGVPGVLLVIVIILLLTGNL